MLPNALTSLGGIFIYLPLAGRDEYFDFLIRQPLKSLQEVFVADPLGQASIFGEDSANHILCNFLIIFDLRLVVAQEQPSYVLNFRPSVMP
jgi:hypothetical protein